MAPSRPLRRPYDVPKSLAVTPDGCRPGGGAIYGIGPIKFGSDRAHTLVAGPLVAGPAPDRPAAITRITAAAIEALHQYFYVQQWPRNRRMPKENRDSGLDAIIKQFALKRDQVSRQLRNWKDKVCMKTQESLVFDTGDVEGG